MHHVTFIEIYKYSSVVDYEIAFVIYSVINSKTSYHKEKQTLRLTEMQSKRLKRKNGHYWKDL